MDMDELRMYWKRHSEAQQKSTLENLKTATTALRNLGVERVVMTYSGGGDSGDYHYPVYTVGGKNLEDRSGCGESSYQLDSSGEFLPGSISVPTVMVGSGLSYEKGEAVYAPTIPTSRAERGLCEAVTFLMENAVSDQHGGWENNEGAEGTVTFDVKEGTLLVEHGSYVMETVWDSHSIRVEDAGD